MMASFLSQVSKITDNLYLSSFVGAAEANLIKYNITCVLTVCHEVPQVSSTLRSDAFKRIETIKLDVMDKPTESLAKYFDFVADKINEVVLKKGVCLVHCVAGISRSATMVLVYLMKYHRMNLKDAHALVKSKRSFIRPNLGFWQQMVGYELSLFGINSVKIIPSNIGFIPDIYEQEVKNMQWDRQMGMPPSPRQSQQQPQPSSHSNNQVSNNYNNFARDKLNNNSNNTFQLQPIIGNANPKFSKNSPNNQNLDNAMISIPKSDIATVDQRSTNNKSHYTTTYRSSYNQK